MFETSKFTGYKSLITKFFNWCVHEKVLDVNSVHDVTGSEVNTFEFGNKITRAETQMRQLLEFVDKLVSKNAHETTHRILATIMKNS